MYQLDLTIPSPAINWLLIMLFRLILSANYELSEQAIIFGQPVIIFDLPRTAEYFTLIFSQL